MKITVRKGRLFNMEITFETVRDIIVDTLSCDAEAIKPEAKLLEDLEADSLEIVELSMALQEKLVWASRTRTWRKSTPSRTF